MQQQYGGFFKRLIAFLIDGIVTYIPFALVFGFDQEKWSPTAWGIYLVLWTGYFVWMVGMYGATIGKIAMKLKIVREDSSKVSYSDALVREIASYLSLIVLCLGYLNIIWDNKKQGWHDKIAKTIVVKV